MQAKDKNKIIGDAIRETYSRRKNQACITIKCKVNRASLRKEQKETLEQMFLEAKWVYNYAVANKIYDSLAYKQFKNITKLDKDKNEVPVMIRTLKSSLISHIIQRISDSIYALEQLQKRYDKENEKHKNDKTYKPKQVGELKFKKEYKSLMFRQYGITHYIKGNTIKFQGISKPIRVCGLKQLNKLSNPEITTIDLKYDGYDYWVNIACYVDKDEKYNKYIKENKLPYLGVDMGTSTTITMSTGEKVDVAIGETERLKKLKRKLKRQTEYSNNWKKTKSLIAKEQGKIDRRKRDIANKIISKMLTIADRVIFQDEQIASWKVKDTKNGKKISTKKTKKVHNSILGRVKHKLQENENCSMLNRWFPTTKYCRYCGTRHPNLKTSDRIFICPKCGHTEDRDIHAANNMIFFYQKYKDTVGTTDTSKLHGCERVFEFKLNGVYGHLPHRPEEGTTSLV